MRMYFFVPRQLSGIDKGIQAGHAAVEFVFERPGDEAVEAWMNEPTFIILNGGTLSDMKDRCMELDELGVNYQRFFEPDLNQSCSAVAFLVPESVYGISDALRECLDEHTEVMYLNQCNQRDVAIWEYLKQFRLASN